MGGQLDFQADQIEFTLAQHRLRGRVTGGTVTPRTLRFSLVPDPSAKLRRFLELAEELALALGAPSCRIFRDKDCLQVEVPREQRSIVSLLPLSERLPQVPPCTAVLGLEHDGRPLLLHLPSPDVSHVLVAGGTGSGKTELTRAMLASLVRFNRQAQLQLLLIDPKCRGFAPFRDAPHLMRPIVTDAEEAVEALRALVDEMIRRDRETRELPRIVLCIDELADLALVAPTEITALLTRLAQRGRQAGIHVIACTQKPTADVVGTLVKANFPVRLVGAVGSPEDAKVATGLAGSGAEKLLGRGDFLIVNRGQVIRFQAAFVPEAQIAGLWGNRTRGQLTPVRLISTGTDGQRAAPNRPVAYLRRVK